MPPLDTATTSAVPSAMTLLTVNPYAYLAALTRQETYALIAAAAAFAIAGALLIQREAAARLFRRRKRA